MADHAPMDGMVTIRAEDIQPGTLADRVKRIHDALVGLDAEAAAGVLIGVVATTVATHLRGHPQEAGVAMERIGQRVRALSVEVSRQVALRDAAPVGRA